MGIFCRIPLSTPCWALLLTHPFHPVYYFNGSHYSAYPYAVGSSIGTTAAIVPLTISAAPFIARVIESSLLEIDHGVIEAAQSMGASPMQIIYKVLLPESLHSIVLGITLAVIALIGYSAMAGVLAAAPRRPCHPLRLSEIPG